MTASSTWKDSVVTWLEATYAWKAIASAFSPWKDTEILWSEATFQWGASVIIKPVSGKKLPPPWMHHSIHPGVRR